MKTTVMIDAVLLEQVKAELGVSDAEKVVEAALREVLHGKASERLAALGGTMPDLEYPRRYRYELDEE